MFSATLFAQEIEIKKNKRNLISQYIESDSLDIKIILFETPDCILDEVKGGVSITVRRNKSIVIVYSSSKIVKQIESDKVKTLIALFQFEKEGKQQKGNDHNVFVQIYINGEYTHFSYNKSKWEGIEEFIKSI